MTAVVQSETRRSLLYRVLIYDGIFAVFSGALFLAGYKIIASLFELDQPAALMVVGLMVITYGAALLIFTRRGGDIRAVAIGAIVLNTLWVAVSYLGLLLGWWDVNSTGRWAIALIAEAILIFAILEIVGLYKISRRISIPSQPVEGM